MIFHCLDGAQYSRVGRLISSCAARPLRVAGKSDFGVHEPVADAPRQVRAMVLGDQGMHQIHWRCSAGARNAVAIDDVKTTLDQQRR